VGQCLPNANDSSSAASAVFAVSGKFYAELMESVSGDNVVQLRWWGWETKNVQKF